MIDRTAISTELAKCLAFLACGQTAKAYDHAHRLIELLRDSGLPNLKH